MKNYFPGSGNSNSGPRPFVYFLIRFLVIFALINYGTRIVNGLVTPGGYYFPFLDQNLDYISWLRHSLLWGAESLMRIFGYDASYNDFGFIWISGGRVVKLSYSCLGVGVMSFWIAYVLTGKSSGRKRAVWLLSGLLALWLINIWRIFLVTLAYTYNWGMPLGIDHHTWFNIVAYVVIFLLIMLHEWISGKSGSGAAGIQNELHP